MTVSAAEWVAAHAEQPPAALRARLDAILGDLHNGGRDPVVTALFESGRDLLTSVLRAGTTQRDVALDLLTADALVTYAFEAAAEAPEALDAHAAAAMRALAAVVDSRAS